MSLLTAFATEAAPLLLSDWGEAVTYLPLNGTAVTRTMAFCEQGFSVEDANGHKRKVRRGQFSAYQDSTTGIANPTVGDKITRNGVAWGVVGRGDGNGGMWLIDVESPEILMTGSPSNVGV